VIYSNRERATHPAFSRQFFPRPRNVAIRTLCAAAPVSYPVIRSILICASGSGLPAVSSTGDFGFESMTLSQAYPEADTKWAVNSIEVCLSGSGHPACGRRRLDGQALSPRWVRQRVGLLVGLPLRGRPHCWRPGTHGDKSERLDASPASLPPQGVSQPGSASGQPLAVCDDFFVACRTAQQ
jgi:hypothetical protein